MSWLHTHVLSDLRKPLILPFLNPRLIFYGLTTIYFLTTKLKTSFNIFPQNSDFDKQNYLIRDKCEQQIRFMSEVIFFKPNRLVYSSLVVIKESLFHNHWF